MHSDSEQLLMRARDGDREALGRLLDSFRNYLMILAYDQIDRRVRGKADASDVVQDTFLYVHQAFSEFRGTTIGELLNWVRSILASKMTDLIRMYCDTQRRDVRLERRLAEELDQTSCAVNALAASDLSPSGEVAQREQAILVADAIAELPPDYREVIILRHFRELTFPEISQTMQRSEGSVKKLWVRALTRLRRIVKGIVDDSVS